MRNPLALFRLYALVKCPSSPSSGIEKTRFLSVFLSVERRCKITNFFWIDKKNLSDALTAETGGRAEAAAFLRRGGDKRQCRIHQLVDVFSQQLFEVVDAFGGEVLVAVPAGHLHVRPEVAQRVDAGFE